MLLQNWDNSFLLQTGAAFFITNWGSLIITNQGSYYKLGQPLLQIGQLLQTGANITDQGSYYKLGQLLQIGA